MLRADPNLNAVLLSKSLFRFPRQHSHRIRGHRAGVTACRATAEADERDTRSGLLALSSVIVEFDPFFEFLAHCNDLLLGDFGNFCIRTCLLCCDIVKTVLI